MKVFILIGLLIQQPLVVTSGSTVSGRLVFSDGVPAPGTTITLASIPEPGQTRTARTDSAGGYRILNVPTGRYVIRAGTPDASAYYPGVLSESAATIITVRADSPVENLNFALPPSASGARVLGNVIFPPNQVAPGSQPAVQLNGGVAGVQLGAIAPDGTFEIQHVRPGSYSLLVAPAPGMQPLRITVADRDVAGIELVVPPLTDVTGKVTADDRARPRFALGFVGAANTGRVLSTVTDGTFAAQLPPGEYRIMAQGLPAGYYFRTLTAGSSNLLTEPLKIAASKSASAIQIVATLGVSSGVRVRGRVKVSGSESAAASSRKIMMLDPILNNVVETTIEADGSFEIEKVMPGTYLTRVALTPTVGTPFATIVIPNRDLLDLEIAAPGLKDVPGRIAVDGNGAPPKFGLLLVKGGDAMLTPVANPSELPVLSASALNSARGGLSDSQILQVDVNALPDGTFKIRIPDGTYRVAAVPGSGGIPPAYFMRSLTYGTARLLTEPFTISATASEEIHVGFGTTEPNPWVKVGGRVKGQDPAKGPFRVALEGSVTATLEAPVNPDGSFEFPGVMQNSAYTVRLLPVNDSVSPSRVTVANKDVDGVEIVVPAEKEVFIRVTVERAGPVPGFALSLAGVSSAMRVVVKPESDGSFKAKLPTDERRVSLSGLPFGYEVKSLTYGSTDLLKEPLRIGAADSGEIQVALVLDPAIPTGSLRGRIRGWDPERGATRIVLHGVAAFSSFEASVGSDGSFSFSRVPQGTYVPVLAGGIDARGLIPSTIVVAGSELAVIEITVPRQSASAARPAIDDVPTGARVSDMGGGSREAANESAAVANLRTINTAQLVYLRATGSYAGVPQLVAAGLLDSTFSGPKAGFSFSIIAMGANYAAVALPASPEMGRFGFYSTPQAVVRYSTVDFLAPPRQSGNPVQ